MKKVWHSLLAFSLILIFIIILMIWKVPTEDVQTIKPNITKKQLLIGVISDTHVPTRADKIPEIVFEKFKGVDLIVHSGDVVELSVIKQLEKIAPVIAVEGNMDFDEIKGKYPKFVIINLLDYRIGVYHGSIFPWELRNIARHYNLDVLISGHTHKAGIERDGTIFINPGSPTNPILSRASVAFLRITEKSIEPEIVFI